MIQRTFDAIDESAITELLDNKRAECKTLEYKETLPGNTDADKKEFLADMSSFANASGGDIVYGIKAEVNDSGTKTGLPGGVALISRTSKDQAILRLEEMIRNGIAPRLQVQIKGLDKWEDGNGFVVVLRVPRSYSSPHVVTYGGSFRFHSRNSAGKYALDVTELRSAFLATESQAERINRFREDRLARIVADETPVRLTAPERMVLHMIPMNSFLTNERLDLSDATGLSSKFPPMGSSGSGHRYNLDGLLFWELEFKEGTGSESYCQLFFNGTVEGVNADFVGRADSEEKGTTDILIPGSDCEKSLIGAVSSYLTGLRGLEVRPPIVILVSILGCLGTRMYQQGEWPIRRVKHRIDRNTLMIPDVIVEEFDGDIPSLLRPVFDAVWNACGYPRSMNYDEEGHWKLRG